MLRSREISWEEIFFLAKNHALILDKNTPTLNDFLPPSLFSYKNYCFFFRVDVVNLNSTTSKCLLCHHILPVMTDAISKVCDISKGFHNKYRIHRVVLSFDFQCKVVSSWTFWTFPSFRHFWRETSFEGQWIFLEMNSWTLAQIGSKMLYSLTARIQKKALLLAFWNPILTSLEYYVRC